MYVIQYYTSHHTTLFPTEPVITATPPQPTANTATKRMNYRMYYKTGTGTSNRPVIFTCLYKTGTGTSATRLYSTVHVIAELGHFTKKKLLTDPRGVSGTLEHQTPYKNGI